LDQKRQDKDVSKTRAESVDWFERIGINKKWVRIGILFTLDLTFSIVAFYLSILLRFGFTFPVKLRRIFWTWGLILFVLQFLTLAFFRLYNIMLRFVGILELLRLLKAFVFSTAAAVALNLFLIRPSWLTLSMSVGVLIIDGLIAFGLFGATRLARRVLASSRPRRARKPIMPPANESPAPVGSTT